jgi:hypothetical protein
MDAEEKHAPTEVEMNEPPEEETGTQNPPPPPPPPPPMEAIPKTSVGEMSLPVDMTGGRVVTLGMVTVFI